MPIKYVSGDVTRPDLGGSPGLLVHVVNSAGGWGRGVVVAISRRWHQPERAYRAWHKNGRDVASDVPFNLGEVQYVQVEPNLYVVNMLAQSGYGKNNLAKHRSDEPNSAPPIRYEALEKCLDKVAQLASELGASVHMPRIGCSLAGGRWSQVESIIARTLSEHPVTVYDLPGSTFNP